MVNYGKQRPDSSGVSGERNDLAIIIFKDIVEKLSHPGAKLIFCLAASRTPKRIDLRKTWLKIVGWKPPFYDGFAASSITGIHPVVFA